MKKIHYPYLMDFGRLNSIEHIDFTLPEDHPANQLILNNQPASQLDVYVGCPIWAHKDWVGKIYPAKAKDKDFLVYYAQQYNCIELNATHYKIPTLSMIARWVADVPDTFKFCPKVPQVISHARNILEMKPVWNEFIQAILHFEKNLGCTFLQLPPYFKPDRLPALIRLLDELPAHFKIAIELRHEDWFKEKNAMDELNSYLSSRQLGWVITDVAGRRDVLHQRFSNTTAFIRFTANDLHPTDYTRLDAWTDRITTWIANGLSQLYFFVHTPDKSLCPELAYYFIQELNRKAGTQVSPPKPLINRQQMDLFG